MPQLILAFACPHARSGGDAPRSSLWGYVWTINDFRFRGSFVVPTTSPVVSRSPPEVGIKRLVLSSPNPTNEHVSESFSTHIIIACSELGKRELVKLLVAEMASVTEEVVDVAQVPLGSAGLVVSAQGLGCMGMSSFYGPPKPDSEMIELIHYAIDRGVTFLDTSDAYGPHTNEVLVGKVWFIPLFSCLFTIYEIYIYT